MLLLINGILGGLVGIIVFVVYVDIFIVIFIGVVSGVVVVLIRKFLKWIKFEDLLGVIFVYFFCGCWGIIVVFFSFRGIIVYEKIYNFLE